jgi:hypothetical protein
MLTLLFLFASTAVAEPKIEYVAPKKGGPSIRLDPDARGNCPSVRGLPSDFKIEVVAPEHLGYTIKAQPVLYWRINKKVRGTIALTIEEMVSDFSFKPLLEMSASLSVKPGLHNYSLSGLKVHLEKDVDYLWTVALVCDRENRSLDIGQSGGVRYVDKPKGVRFKDLKELAQKGVWYDVFHRVGRANRQRLLNQVGL